MSTKGGLQARGWSGGGGGCLVFFLYLARHSCDPRGGTRGGLS